MTFEGLPKIELMNTPSEIKTELANALSHGLGILFTIVASPVLVAMVVPKSNPTLTFSTLYHAFDNPLVKKTLRIFDHISIFFLIGGSYAPFIVLCTSPQTAFWFLIAQWTLIALGIVIKVFYTGKYRLLSSINYIFIGCMVFFLGSDFWNNMPEKSIYFLATGGLLYLVGVIFYQNRKIPYNHFIWHLFVLSAAVFIYFGVLVAV
jgi:hemolysin III